MVNVVSLAALALATTIAVALGDSIPAVSLGDSVPVVSLNASMRAVSLSASIRAEVAPMPNGAWPTSQGDVYFEEPYTVKKGEVYDGEMKTYQLSNVKCRGDTESGWQNAVFVVEAGGTLKNAIIGTDQMEGSHCDDGDCLYENVWWDDVCEDALSIKGGSERSVTRVIGGGARSASDKVVQHNGYGSLFIEGFYVENYSQFYRSCGNCGNKDVKISIKNLFAVDGRVRIVTQNKGDEVTIKNVKIKGNKVEVCSVGTGASRTPCRYSPSNVTYV
ncbi:unnamed protein product [Hyaloperonospora brassicae]|uniref:Probable pectate lyase F n=1 Tax=Hyaloperonospora brassicae TaxID=162125 RepID=A0AAV0TPU1_HYABA|nr:unnamed protein product [Hyaloperonospora brassicae]